MSELYHSTKKENGEDDRTTIYFDRQFYTDFEAQVAALKGSTTIYVGNLNFTTTEQQLYDFFSRAGAVKRIIMGLNKQLKTPCGFCFVEFYTQEHTGVALKCLNQTCCDGIMEPGNEGGRVRLELDGGFKPSRQWGRSKSGGQARDNRNKFQSPPPSGAGDKRKRESSGFNREVHIVPNGDEKRNTVYDSLTHGLSSARRISGGGARTATTATEQLNDTSTTPTVEASPKRQRRVDPESEITEE